MNTMELQVINKEIPNIDFVNYELMKSALEKSLEKYKGLVYSEEEIKAAKKDKANLNKLSKELNAKRLELSKAYSQPVAVFKEKVDSLITPIKEVVMEIDKQVQGYEEQQKKDKKRELNHYFQTQIASNSDLLNKISIENCFNEKWLNSTFKIKEAKKEIDLFIDKTQSDYTIIKSLGSEFELTLLEMYFTSFNITTVLEKNNKLIALQKEEQEQARVEAERKREAEIQERIAKEAQALADEKTKQEAEKPKQAEESKALEELIIDESDEGLPEIEAEPAVETKGAREYKLSFLATEGQKELIDICLQANNIKHIYIN